MIQFAALRFLLTVVMAVSTTNQSAPAPALSELMQQAQAGDAAAQAQLARAYEDGKGVPQSDELAAEWYRKSAEQGNARAQNDLGTLYSVGQGVPRDKAEAFRWYQKAAKLGLAEAAYNVGISYYNGDGSPSDLELAYAWMLVAQSRGDAQAEEPLKRIGGELDGRVDGSEFKLAALYEAGEELTQDLAAAADLYGKVAKVDPQRSSYVFQAQYKLCQMYGAARGVAENWVEAKSWCKKAAKNGATVAYVVLGRMAEQGKAGEKNLKEAVDWYRDAALEREPVGFLELGRLKSLSGSHQDEKEAYFWFYLGQKTFSKNPAFGASAQEAAARLSKQEISAQQAKAAVWLRMGSLERAAQIKTHY